MMDRIQKIELEITSDCNAACPGCARTQKRDILEVVDFSLNDLKRILPQNNISTLKILDYGVLGDP